MASLSENCDSEIVSEIEPLQVMAENECEKNFLETKGERKMVESELEFVSGVQDCQELKANGGGSFLEIREYQEMVENEVDFGDCKKLKSNGDGKFSEVRDYQKMAENERDFRDCEKSKVNGGGKCENRTEGFSEMREDQEKGESGGEFEFEVQDCGKLKANGGEGYLAIKEYREKAEIEVECEDCERLKTDDDENCEKITERFSKMKEDQETGGDEGIFVSEVEDRKTRRENLFEIEGKGEMVESEIESVHVGQNQGELKVKDSIECERSTVSLSEIKGDQEMVETDIKHHKNTESILEIQENQEMAGTHLGFEVISSDTQIECEKVGNCSTGYGKHRGSSSEINGKKENEGNTKKASRRRAKSTRNNVLKIDGKQEIPNFCEKKVNGSGRGYSMVELQALRFVNVEEQEKRWNEIYLGLGSVARELDGIAATTQPKQGRKNADRRQRKKKAAGLLNADRIHDQCGEEFSQNVDNGYEEVHPIDFVSAEFVNEKENCVLEQHEFDESEDSDDDYNSLQRPAFLVEGEPDFESGPPQDGWEFLRRVRWEAAQIPKVTVAKVDRGKLNSEQTAYMPIIPDIAECPAHLLPSKHWEDEFLTDFSDLRLALSRIEHSDNWVVYTSERDCGKHSDNLLQPKDIPAGEHSGNLQQPKDIPAVSSILCLDAVSRATMLRKRANTFDNAITLSRDDALWLFAICAAVEKPLDAVTSASIRCLLRKCASLRAAKTEFDDELVMLNMIITIAGKYFRQMEC